MSTPERTPAQQPPATKNLDIDRWLKSGRYLPEPLRDFHGQKDVFKAMHDLVAVKDNEYAATVTWIAGQCYVIDVFLWFMAKRGWTLQRVRARGEFRDLAADVQALRDAETQAFRDYLASRTHAQKGTNP